MNSSDHLSDNEVAFAAINLFSKAPVGPEPDWTEVEDWHAGTLDATRAEEVLSHVANNAEVFQMWRDICEAEQWLAESPLEDASSAEQSAVAQQSTTSGSANPAPYDLVGWIRKGFKAISEHQLPAIGGAVTATLLAVLIVPKLISNTPGSAGDMIGESLAQYSAMGAPLPQTVMVPRQTRSLAGVLGDISEDDVMKHQLSFGLQQGYSALNIPNADDFAPWFASLPTETIDCTLAASEDNCAQVSGDMAYLGQWALVNHFACRSGIKLPADFLERQSTSLTKLTEMPTINQNARLKSVLPQSGATVDSLCSVSDELVAIASE